MTLGPYTEEEVVEEEEEEEKVGTDETLKIRKYSRNDEIHKIHISQVCMIYHDAACFLFLLIYILLFKKVRQMFERFLKEKKEYGRMKEKLDRIEKTLFVVRHKFSNTIEKYFQVQCD